MSPLVLILILILLHGGGGGYYAFGPYGGIGIGGIVLIILLVSPLATLPGRALAAGIKGRRAVVEKMVLRRPGWESKHRSAEALEDGAQTRLLLL
jgi:hypothetical protein